jgi:hypothetical protein
MLGNYIEFRFATIYLNLIDSVGLNPSLKVNSCSVSHLPHFLFHYLVHNRQQPLAFIQLQINPVSGLPLYSLNYFKYRLSIYAQVFKMVILKT